ncbi:hypothetical protein LMG27174_06513 [Paraburkholderia rhynchosiae]|uniref:Uncharacterized protein n=1 Tax=Paraburkholderia rhynchosiae TaxID=487049 RepID=A0A6J5CNT7_9BURK|nr:hypothetical protein LMG27174_06513 [Paraburkholderia rhynchosiae]
MGAQRPRQADAAASRAAARCVRDRYGVRATMEQLGSRAIGGSNRPHLAYPRISLRKFKCLPTSWKSALCRLLVIAYLNLLSGGLRLPFYLQSMTQILMGHPMLSLSITSGTPQFYGHPLVAGAEPLPAGLLIDAQREGGPFPIRDQTLWARAARQLRSLPPACAVTRLKGAHASCCGRLPPRNEDRFAS